jgi:GNAT superfamily N-acetyltransferase
MRLSVRATRSSDLSAVDALLARSYPRLLKDAYAPSVLVTALPLISRAQPKLVACGTYYGAWDGDRLVGVGGWTQDPVSRVRGHVRHVATDERVTRRGVGRTLLGHVLDTARDAGLREMVCMSTRNAVAFYGSLGFHEIGPIDVALQPGITFPCMRMHLSLV